MAKQLKRGAVCERELKRRSVDVSHMHVRPMIAVIMWVLCIVVLLRMIVDSIALVDALNNRWFERELLHLT